MNSPRCRPLFALHWLHSLTFWFDRSPPHLMPPLHTPPDIRLLLCIWLLSSLGIAHDGLRQLKHANLETLQMLPKETTEGGETFQPKGMVEASSLHPYVDAAAAAFRRHGLQTQPQRRCAFTLSHHLHLPYLSTAHCHSLSGRMYTAVCSLRLTLWRPLPNLCPQLQRANGTPNRPEIWLAH